MINVIKKSNSDCAIKVTESNLVEVILFLRRLKCDYYLIIHPGDSISKIITFTLIEGDYTCISDLDFYELGSYIVIDSNSAECYTSEEFEKKYIII